MTEFSALRMLRIQGELRRRAVVEFANRAAPLAVIVHLSDQLDDETFRSKKAEAVALELGIPDSTAADALRLLVERSYLEEGERINRVKSYRLAGARQ